MQSSSSRRSFLRFASLTIPIAAATHAMAQSAPGTTQSSASTATAPVAEISDAYPTQPPELIREMVTVAHFNLTRVKELVGARPALARAAQDWGFGDWEDALGAASHTGNRPIA